MLNTILTIIGTVIVILFALPILTWQVFLFYVRERHRIRQRAAFGLALKVWKAEHALGYEQLSDAFGYEAPLPRYLSYMHDQGDYMIYKQRGKIAPLNHERVGRPGPSAYDGPDVYAMGNPVPVLSKAKEANCPRCGAVPGVACSGPSGFVMPHSERAYSRDDK